MESGQGIHQCLEWWVTVCGPYRDVVAVFVFAVLFGVFCVGLVGAVQVMGEWVGKQDK